MLKIGRGDIPRRAADPQCALHEARSGQAFILAEQLFAQDEKRACADRIGDIHHHARRIAKQGVHPLQLGEDRAQRQRALWNADAGKALDRQTVRQRVGDGFVAAHGFGQFQAVFRRFAFSLFFKPAMFVAVPDFEIEHLLADDAEPEMPRFDDSGMNRADRNLIDAFAGKFLELIGFMRLPGQIERRVDKRFPQWVDIFRVHFMQKEPSRIKRALERDAESVVNLALVQRGNWAELGDALRGIRRKRVAQNQHVRRSGHFKGVKKRQSGIRLKRFDAKKIN